MSCNVRTRKTIGSYLKDIIRWVHWCQKRAVLCRFRATKYTNTICHANFFLKAFTKMQAWVFWSLWFWSLTWHANKSFFEGRPTYRKTLQSTYSEIQEASRQPHESKMSQIVHCTLLNLCWPQYFGHVSLWLKNISLNHHFTSSIFLFIFDRKTDKTDNKTLLEKTPWTKSLA